MKFSLGKNKGELHPIIREIQQEFRQHVATSPTTVFEPRADLAQAFSKLTRDLESKRQIAALTAPEILWLNQIDQLLEDISRFNLKTVDSSPEKKYQNNVYNLNLGQVEKEQELLTSPSIPKISEEDAEKIIATIDAQFSEKVLKKIKAQPGVDALSSDEVQNFSISLGPDSVGRNLNDYLTTVRNDLPAQPFMDDDSHTDLSKIKLKSKHAVRSR